MDRHPLVGQQTTGSEVPHQSLVSRAAAVGEAAAEGEEVAEGN